MIHGKTYPPRELGTMGTAGTMVASFGMLLVVAYFISLYWLVSFMVDATSYFWMVTFSFGWTVLLAGAIITGTGGILMAMDWKRRPEILQEPAVRKDTRLNYESMQPVMQQNIEA
jgi:hypothetical protein